MTDLEDLYQALILDHAKRPRNFGALSDANAHAEGYNPLCGDRLQLFLRLRDDKLETVQFTGSGCAISTASASLLTEVLKGKTLADAKVIFEAFHRLITEEGAGASPIDLGKLAVFAGVREFPTRVKCATLAWHTVMSALEGRDVPVSTE